MDRGEIWRFRASHSSLEALFFRHGGRIDRPYGECQLTRVRRIPAYHCSVALAQDVGDGCIDFPISSKTEKWEEKVGRK
jgi:hypothetical protein